MKSFPINEQWLNSRVEPALEPQLPIIDPHHHLWNRPDKKYVASDFAAEILSGHNVEQSVYLECGSFFRTSGPEEARSLGETEYVQQVGADYDARQQKPRIAAGIVSYVDLFIGDAAAPLLAEHEKAGKGRLKGIRNPVSWHADERFWVNIPAPKRPVVEGMLMDPAFRQGYSHLKEFGLSFDCWLYHTQLGELQDVASKFPDTQVIINHIGGPIGTGRHHSEKSRKEAFADWSNALKNIAKLPNTWLKFGGLAMNVLGLCEGCDDRAVPASSDELTRIWEAYFDVCMEAFGPSRTMFESNFPPDKGAVSYTTLWNTFKKLSLDMSEQERARLFSETAREVYRL